VTLDPRALVDDLTALVRVPSATGRERAALELVCAQAQALGLQARIEEEDLAAVRAHADHPGEEVERTELVNARVSVPGGPRRLALCAHVDVVDPGSVAWTDGNPYSGVVRDGAVYGRGSLDMKAGVVAALHAMAAARDADCAVDLLVVSSEEDGGLGAFAALQRDAAYDGCVIPEPTGFDVVCAQAGAITFTGVVTGVSAHAAERLHGVSAIDRYLPVHAALAAYERDVNASVQHELMRKLDLPYPLLVGKLRAGTWSSQVPDRLEFEGRAPVRVGETVENARAVVEAAIAAADPAAAVAVTWSGGSFASAETDPADPLVRLVRDATNAERGGEAALAGVPWGADMRLFCAQGIPTVMVGTTGIERAHAVDEHVVIDEVLALTRILACVIRGF
jgi:acetylornithine deacetylase